MSNIVEHPETGKPAREVKSYVELDQAQLEQELADNQANLDEVLATKRAAFEASFDQDEEVKAARSAVEESKSELAQYQSIAPSEQSDAGEAGASGEVEGVDAAEDQSDGADGSPADNGDGAVEVPVTVADPADQY